MKRIILPVIMITMASMAAGFKMAGHGENQPTVQSALDGRYYVRTVPNDDYGTKGNTKVFQVGRDGDKLLDDYPVYMRGRLFLIWSPIAGKWCLVHLEPERITSNNDSRTVGRVSRLAFYMGGKSIKVYTNEDLEKMGLMRSVQTLVHKQRGQFIVHGIYQVPRTNHYVLKIEKTSKDGNDTETVLLDVTTGKAFSHESEGKAEQENPPDKE